MQPEGAKAITLLGRAETQLPEVGEVLVLSVEDVNGVVSSSQYVRISDVSSEVRTFVDASGEYARRVLTLTLTSALRQTFVGAEASRFSNVTTPTKVRTTTIADAVRYYGVTRLNGAVLQNALEISVDSIFSQIVPSTTREVPFAGARPGLTLNHVAIGAARSEGLPGQNPQFLYRGVLPKSVTSGSNGVTSDDGTGNLVAGTTDIGDIDYESGRLSGQAFTSLSYTPAVAVQRNSYTVAVEIELGNQGTVYVQTLPVAPAPKTLRVDYRYLGKWYTLEDKQGLGTLAGATPSEGGGTIDYQTGNVVVTLGALPDVGSRLIFSAGQNTDFVRRDGTVTPTSPKVEFQLTDPAEPGAAITFSWTSNGVTKNATAAANTGVISGDATGSALFSDGFVAFAPNANAWPDSNSTLLVNYTKALGGKGSVLGSYAGDIVTFTVPAGSLPVRQGGFLARIPTLANGHPYDLWIKDDGAGGLVLAAPRKTMDSAAGGLLGGSINYSTGEVTVQIGPASGVYVAKVFKLNGGANQDTRFFQWAWENAQFPLTINASVLVQYWATKVSAGTQAVTEEITFPGVSLYLGQGFTDALVAGSVWFTWGGKEYIDRQGKIFRDMNRSNGSVTEAGTINYQTGEVRLTNWGTTTGGNATLRTLLTTVGILPVSQIVFRTPGAPVRPASVYIQAVRSDTGTLITGTSTLNGPLSASKMQGFADHDMGWVEVFFGEYVPAAGNENESWYDAANVVGANVWKPIPVDPNTIEFNCVVLSTLPLDADLLGIDPVRLPQTGKVPIVREGDVVVIHEPREFVFPNPLSAGQVVTLPDAPVNQLVLVDNGGSAVPVSKYTADLQAGSVTMANPLDLTGLVQPLKAQYVVEDMVLVSGVELSGKVSLVSPLSRAYADNAWVSSALLFGDLRGDNPIFFSQQTWTGAWSDERISSNTTAQYNRTLYPLQLVNANAITERWALIFTSGTGGNIVGETLGQIGTFTTGVDVEPINPVTGAPYFKLLSAGFGAGWGVNNVLRFNTIGPNAPVWIARTILPGAQALADDAFQLQMRGDAD